jgi:hypothetical protein
MRRYVIDIDFSSENIISYLETFEQQFYPVFFKNEIKEWLHLWYWNKLKEYSEFLDIIIDQKWKKVVLERDIKATLILFCYFDKSRLIISSDYNYFAQHLDLKNMINEDFLKLELWHWKITNTSVCNNIHPLFPRKKYIFSNNKKEVIDSIYTHKTIELQDILHQNFCNLNEHNKVGAEISWWKDSAFLPILAKKSTYFPFEFISWQLHSWEVWEQQWWTLSKVVNFLDIPYQYHVITEHDYPLKNESVGVMHHPVEEIYKNSLLWEIEILKRNGINTIFNGFWWDEAFQDRNNKSIDFTDKSNEFLSFIFQDNFIEDVYALNQSSPFIHKDAIFQTSVYDALICRNNFYIHHGIRPMTPYLNIDAYEYFQSLQVTKQQFFTAFYNNFDPQLVWAFDKNTNMSKFFESYFKSEFFNNLLQSCLSSPTKISSYYKIDTIKKYFSYTPLCWDNLIHQYSFMIYKFVKISLMLK